MSDYDGNYNYDEGDAICEDMYVLWHLRRQWRTKLQPQEIYVGEVMPHESGLWGMYFSVRTDKRAELSMPISVDARQTTRAYRSMPNRGERTS